MALPLPRVYGSFPRYVPKPSHGRSGMASRPRESNRTRSGNSGFGKNLFVKKNM